MEKKMEQEGLRSLERIEDDIEIIKERTPSPVHAFLYGLLQGAGWIIGSIVTLALIGSVLSLFGLIPGLNHLVPYLQSAVNQYHAR